MRNRRLLYFEFLIIFSHNHCCWKELSSIRGSLVENKSLSVGHARALIGLNNSSDLAKKIVQKKLSVRQVETLVRQFKNKKFKLINKKDSNILDLQKILEEKTGLNVSITNKKNNSGNISFHYKDLEQLDKIIDVIKNNY